jgi:hypothetical protein
MTLYHCGNPFDDIFARAWRRGTWSPAPKLGVCPECTASRQKRVSPLVLEWQPELLPVGDFTWPGFDEVVVTERVRNLILDRCRTVIFESVVQIPSARATLYDLQPQSWANLDMQRSGVSLLGTCGTCGRSSYNYPPFASRDLVIDLSTWDHSDIFKIREYPSWIFWTERARAWIGLAACTNVYFHIDGTIPGHC